MTIDQLSNLIKDPNIFGYLIVRPFGLILLSLYNFVHNYGLAVILFALIVKLCCVPLAIKGKKSMLAMTALNAEMQQLQKKYANNRAKLNEEIQALYERRGVSPMSGCLPQFIPLPIMMGLYYAVQQPLQYIVGLSSETVIKLAQLVGLDNLAGANYTVQIVIAEKLNAFKDAAGNFAPDVLKCLADGESIFPMDFNFFGLNLADTPSIKHPGLIWIIPILSCLTAYLSSYIMQKMQNMPKGNDAAANQMKMMTMLMPLMSLCYPMIIQFQAMGRVKESLICSILRKGVLDIPLLFLMDGIIPIYGCMAVQPIVDAISLVVALRFYQKISRTGDAVSE